MGSPHSTHPPSQFSPMPYWWLRGPRKCGIRHNRPVLRFHRLARLIGCCSMGQSKRFTESWRLGRLNSARKTYSTPPVLPRWRLESHSLLHPCLLQSGQLSCHRCWKTPGRVEVGRGLCMLGGLARGRRGKGVAFCDRLLASKTKKVRCGKIPMHVR